mgnify:CR=1 FL=1
MATRRAYVSYDELQDEAEKLLALLKERETGMFSWHMMINERLKAIHGIICPLFSPK